jgi:hypothetical protein
MANEKVDKIDKKFENKASDNNILIGASDNNHL